MLAMACSLQVSAQSDSIFYDGTAYSRRQVTEGTNVKMAGIGMTNILDTYISPEKYTGTSVCYILLNDRKSRRYQGITYRLVHQGQIDYTRNRADNNNEMGGLYNFQYAVRCNWRILADRLLVSAGGGLDANLGFLYNTRNSNNPAQARLSLNLAPSASLRYACMLWHKQCFLNYDVQFPLVGILFSPNYGQSYYEIFSEGNYDHNVVPTTFVSTPSVRQMLSFDFPLAHTWIRVGLTGDCQQAKINHLKYHNYTHALVIGIVRNFTLIHYKP